MQSVKADKKNEIQMSGIFEKINKSEHEQVVFCNDKTSNLKTIIAIHDTTLGPTLGGTRFWNYQSESAALDDVLRLSRGMTYKAAITGVNLGGGKAVVIGNPSKIGTEQLWRRYGQFVNSFGGKYITAEDVGTTTKDMEYVSMETKYVTGKPSYLGGGENPSPITAYGTYLGMKACAKRVWGTDSLKNRKVFVEGVGNVGTALVELLHKEEVQIWIKDINPSKTKYLQQSYNVQIVEDDGYDLDIDIYSPCALGATLKDNTISRLRCSIVAGAANNQLKDEKTHCKMLKDKGILYAPDFLINAGGIINCYVELQGYNKERAIELTENIYARTLQIIKRAEDNNSTTHEAAIFLAQKRINSAIN